MHCSSTRSSPSARSPITVLTLAGGFASTVGWPSTHFLIGAVGGLVANFLFGFGSFFIDAPAQWAGTGAEKHIVQPAVFAHGMTSHNFLLYLATVWGINGYFQSFGALSIVKVNAHWFHVRERGTFAGIFGVLIRIGLVLGQSVAPLMISVFGGWQWAYWVPAALLLVMTALNWKYMENSPEDAGFGEFDTGDGGGDPEEKAPGILTILTKVFTNPVTLGIALASMMVGLVRRSVLDGAWINLYYKEMFAIDRTVPLWHIIYWLSATTGIAGGFLFGMASDRIFTGRRAPVVVFGFGGMALGLLALFGAHHLQIGIPATIVAMLLLSFAVNGAHGMIGGAASMDFGGRKAAAISWSSAAASSRPRIMTNCSRRGSARSTGPGPTSPKRRAAF